MGRMYIRSGLFLYLNPYPLSHVIVSLHKDIFFIFHHITKSLKIFSVVNYTQFIPFYCNPFRLSRLIVSLSKSNLFCSHSGFGGSTSAAEKEGQEGPTGGQHAAQEARRLYHCR
jgi:hypothetical protein